MMISNKERLPNPPDNKCPTCRLGLISFRSLRYKLCIECYQEFDYELKEKTPPLILHQR